MKTMKTNRAIEITKMIVNLSERLLVDRLHRGMAATTLAKIRMLMPGRCRAG